MPTTDDSITIPVEADYSGFQNAIGDMSKQSRQFAQVFGSTMRSAVTSGQSFEDTLKSLALRLSSLALKSGLKPLESLAGNIFEQVLGGIASSFGKGGAASQSVVPFARGGVISQPSYFSMGAQVGLMGEAGAEAVLPLARGSDGRLGVRASGQGTTPAVNVTFNVSTPDVAGFRKSEARLTAMLARTVGRGQRSL